jgi:hypothetical protein
VLDKASKDNPKRRRGWRSSAFHHCNRNRNVEDHRWLIRPVGTFGRGGRAARYQFRALGSSRPASPSEPMCEEAATSANGAPGGFSKLKRRHGSQNLTKFDVKSVQTLDVKSRIDWTAQRRQLLREMWERGERVSASRETPANEGAAPGSENGDCAAFWWPTPVRKSDQE